jgi:3-oxoacyl-[acyl-carrier protein] reductase
MTKTNELVGMRAVITGSSSGIGAAIAEALASAGAACFLHARKNALGLNTVTQQLQSRYGVEVASTLADLADPATHEPLIESACDWAGNKGIDIWVNNAGADVLTGEAAKWPFEQKLEMLWKVDVAATIGLSRMAGAQMKAQGRGAIVNMGWDQAEHGMAGDSGELFGATKGAVIAFSRSLARSLAPQVRVNCVAPGWIKTAWGDHASSYWQERAKRESLLERWGTAEDVAAAVRFLASPAASFITGHVLPINGGLRQT